jgi:multimeric flavodoxin WrbA
MAQKILGIVGSPRRNGNTEVLVDEVLKGAEEAGAQVEKVILNELDIKPCQACNSCYKTGKCIHDDDMTELFIKMEKADAWVLGTPVYWFGPTAQFKLFLDRWYNPIHKKFKGKRVILVIPLGDKNESIARHTVGMITDSLKFLRVEIFKTLLAPGINRRGVVRENTDLLNEATLAGKSIMT